MFNNKKKNRGRLLVTLLFLSIFFCFKGREQAEASSRLIRVGYYPLRNYHAEDNLGNVTGYEVEYLNKIAEVTGWKYEYIKAGSWDEALLMLKNGEVDLLSPGQMTDSRIRTYGFSASPAGKVYGAVATLPENNLVFEDFDAFQSITFGVEKGVSYYELFRKYGKDNGFHPKMIVYDNNEDLLQALKIGAVDAVVYNIMRMESNMKLLGKFGGSSFYFMFQKGNSTLEKQLNDAMAQIDTEFPDFQNELTNKFFPVYNLQPLTKNEMDFVKEVRELTIGCPVNMDPVCYVDENGEVAGITRDILDRIAENTGLTFRYEALPEGEVDYDYLRDHKIDIISCVEYNSVNVNSAGMELTIPYLNAQKVIIGKQCRDFSKNDDLNLGLVTGSKTINRIVETEYPRFKITRFYTIEDCMDAILEGKIDVMLQNQYTVENYLRKPKYEELAIVPSEGIQDHLSLSMVIAQNGKGKEDELLADSRLLAALNKGIANLAEEEVSKFIIKHTIARSYQFTMGDFLYRYRIPVGLLTILLCIGIILSLRLHRLQKCNIEILQESEYKLQNITNNINGGVVVLLPSKGLKISYANDGFLELLKYNKDDYCDLVDKDYIMYVHPDDIEMLYSEVDTRDREPKQISLRIRILRKDGKYIPTMFNATLSVDENGDCELYCVVLDISSEMEMLNKLAFEQEKHSLLIEKSKEMLYEIDMKNERMHVSDTFREKFGWSLPRKMKGTKCEDMAESWHVVREDKKALLAMFKKSMERHEDAACQVRLIRADGVCFWCEISQYSMFQKETDNLIFVGKIVDVDEDVKKLEQWKAKSQYDALTGLYNKEAFSQMAQEYLKGYRKEAALIFVDLDNFKNVNDKLGHLTGDEAIMDAAQKLRQQFASGDLLSRFGGDEFCVLAKNVVRQELEEKLKEVGATMRQTYVQEGESVMVTASIGVALTAQCGDDLKELTEYADKALYYVKENGKGQYAIYHKSMQ